MFILQRYGFYAKESVSLCIKFSPVGGLKDNKANKMD